MNKRIRICKLSRCKKSFQPNTLWHKFCSTICKKIFWHTKKITDLNRLALREDNKGMKGKK